MKKNILLMVFLVQLSWQANSQVTIGTGLVTNRQIPIEPYYSYTYSQVLYLASEIGASGNITTLTYYATPSTTLNNSNDWTIYMGHSTRTSFAGPTSWEPSANLTQTFTGIVTIAGGMVTITLDTPFNYNGIDNLIIAIDENSPNYDDDSSEDFYTTTSVVTRSLSYYNDTINPNPTALPNATVWHASFANVTLGGIAQYCAPPAGLWALQQTPTTHDIGWMEFGTATTWDIEWGAMGFVQGTGTMITGTTTNPHTLTGLTPNTTYGFYVRADCASSGKSTWDGPLNFTTKSNTSVPFLESFEAASLSISSWSQIQEVGAGNWTFATGAGGGTILAAQGGNQNARFVSQSGTNTPITKLVSPVFDLTTLTTPELTFYYGQEDWVGGQNKLKVYYRISSSDPWVEIAYDTTNVAAWTLKTLILPNPSATYQIAFEAINNYGRANVIDNVEIKEALLLCSIPSNLTAFNITQTSALLDWVENGTATEWNIEWGVQGFVLGTGIPVHIMSKSHLLNGLMPSTTYDYYVQSDCGTDSSAWVGPYSFITPPCVTIGLELGADTTLCSTQSLTLDAPTGGSYDWSWSTGESTPSIVIDTTSLGGNGTYNISVVIMDFNTTCFYNDDINVTYSVCVGLNESVTSLDFSVYPNPNDGTFTIEHNLNGKKCSLEIIDLMGKIVHRQLLETKSEVVQINTHQLTNGIYFVTISNQASEQIVKKLVIQK